LSKIENPAQSRATEISKIFTFKKSFLAIFDIQGRKKRPFFSCHKKTRKKWTFYKVKKIDFRFNGPQKTFTRNLFFILFCRTKKCKKFIFIEKQFRCGTTSVNFRKRRNRLRFQQKFFCFCLLSDFKQVEEEHYASRNFFANQKVYFFLLPEKKILRNLEKLRV
jgi:hypothetical protein